MLLPTGPTMFAALRPDPWDGPLFMHVGGAMLMVGGLLGAALALISGRERWVQATGFRILLLVALPGFILMRAGAEWIRSREHWGDSTPTWMGIGYLTSDIGFLLMLVALILGGVWARRKARGGGERLSRAAGIICGVLMVAYVVTIWAMSAKPS